MTAAPRAVAIVGCGIARAHIAEGYARLPQRFRVAALCDIDAGRLAALAEEFAVPRRTASFAEVLRFDDIDIVDLCTPPALHVEEALAALAAGKDVVCEKPVAGSLAAIDRLIAAEREARGRVLPVFQYRFGDGVQKARLLTAAGLLGTPYLATVETAWRRTPDYYAAAWRARPETALGGVLLAQAIHAHDLLTWLLGPPASVFARTATRVNPVRVEDCAVASLVMQNGALAALAATLGSMREITRLRLCFAAATIESAVWPYRPGDEPWQITPASPEADRRIAAALAGYRPVPSGFAGLMEAYADALDTGGDLPVTLADARASLELASALYHSAATGAAVDLPIGPGHPAYHGWTA
jgi:predicted dehydrogenase